MNLLINSVRYGRDGGTTRVSFVDMYDRVMIEVADNGVGIAEEYIPRVFERFFRVDKSRSREQGGTGLGLAIVKHILEAHGQVITLRSNGERAAPSLLRWPKRPPSPVRQPLPKAYNRVRTILTGHHHPDPKPQLASLPHPVSYLSPAPRHPQKIFN